MLTISKPLSSGQAHNYHRQEFSNSQDNYYTEGERIRGEWQGKLAKQWGLTGEVQEEHFTRLADGHHPFSEESLVRHRAAYEYVNDRGQTTNSMEHRAGWDATFSAPKSVSLTALVGNDEQVREAHRKAVDTALDELERYVQARIGGNHAPETTGKWIAAKFEHDSSRPVDGYAAPQLHTHVVLFNVTERSNGETRALQPQELYRSQQYATAVYRSELALRLKELGYQIEQSPNGAPEIKGYTQEYLDASSPRRRQIQEHLAQEGFGGAEAAEIAAHRTRDAKLEISHEEMQQRHRDLAEQHGNQPDKVVQEAQDRALHIQHTDEEQIAKATEVAVHYAIEKNFEREAVSEERDLMRDALKRGMGDVPFDRIRGQLKNEIDRGGLIEMEQQPGEIRREFTTREMIHLERDTLHVMQQGQNQYPALVRLGLRREIEHDHPHLSNSQRAAVQEILNSRDQITGLEGVAGAGKTTSLTAIREAAEREGYTVQGFAPTSRAAHLLAEAGIDSSTLQHHLARGPNADDEKKHLYVLDESSLASTRQMNQFLHGLHPHDRVLLVGDVRQHEAVEAGRPYHQLQQAGMKTAHLDEIVRQKDPALKEAVEQLSRRAVHEAIQNLDRQGRIQEFSGREERFQEIAREYLQHPQGTLVVSPDNESRRELNLLIHGEMQDQGHVKEEEHPYRVLEPRQELTGADRGWAAQYQADDVLRYSRGSKLVGVGAGEYATVKQIDSEKNLLTVERNDGKQVTYDPRRLQGVSVYREAEREFAEGDRVQFTAPSKELHIANRELGTIVRTTTNGEIAIHTDEGRLLEFHIGQHPHVDYGYAMTSHSGQGQTADRVLVHVDTERSKQLVNTRMAYVAVSRGRYDAQIYTNDKEELAETLSRDSTHRTATDAKHEHAQHSEQKVESASSFSHDAAREHGEAGQGHTATGHQASEGATSQGQAEGAGQGQSVGE
jgi:conjugative relaxase-like TrwC/TraI family protein